MKYIECVRVLDDHVYGAVGPNWYYICDGVHYVEVGDQYVEVKCDSNVAQLKDYFVIRTSETKSGIAYTKNTYTRSGSFRKKEFYSVDDVIRLSKIKVESNPEYFLPKFEILREMDIRKEGLL